MAVFVKMVVAVQLIGYAKRFALSIGHVTEKLYNHTVY